MHFELLFLLAVNQGTSDIGRQEVRGELDSGETAVHCFRESAYGQCLRQSWHTFEQNMSIRKEGYLQILHEMLLSYDDLTHLHREQIHE